MAYQMRFLPPLQALMGLYANLATVRVSLRRVSRDSRRAGRGRRRRRRPSPLPAVRGDIAFEDVTLSFDRGAPVLEHLSFSVRAGEVLAIVGPSGSGKSTIADLLLRLLDPDSGVVRLDGHDLRTVRLDDLRRHVALVDQEPCMLHATIAENIRYARPDATDADVADGRAAGGARRLHRAPARQASRRSSASGARRCRPASGSASPSRARSWRTRRSWSSTSRARRSIRRPSGRSRTATRP